MKTFASTLIASLAAAQAMDAAELPTNSTEPAFSIEDLSFDIAFDAPAEEDFNQWASEKEAQKSAMDQSWIEAW